MAAKVDSASGYQSRGTSVAATLSSAPTSGNMIVALVVEQATTLYTGTTIGSGKNLTQAAAPSNANAYTFMLYRLSDGTESATITATFSGDVSAWIWVGEFSGADTFQSVATNTGSSTPITCGTDGDASTVLDVGLIGDDDISCAFSGATPSGFTLDTQGTGSPSFAVLYDTDRGDSNNPQTTGIANGFWASGHLTFELAPTGINTLRLRQDGKY